MNPDKQNLARWLLVNAPPAAVSIWEANQRLERVERYLAGRRNNGRCVPPAFISCRPVDSFATKHPNNWWVKLYEFLQASSSDQESDGEK